MDPNAQKEQFSLAFVGTIVAAAGFKFGPAPQPDDESVDAVMRSGDGRFPQIDLQLKCTSKVRQGDETWTFRLKVKNYEDLRLENCHIPRVLVVVSVPGRAEDWVQTDNLQLIAHYSARWLSLRGAPSRDNVETVSVRVPEAQRFDTSTVQELFYKVERGEL